MEILKSSVLENNVDKLYYGFKLLVSTNFTFRNKTPVTELYVDQGKFYVNKKDHLFCYKNGLYGESYLRVFDNFEEAKEAWNNSLQNQIDRCQSIYEKKIKTLKSNFIS